MEKQPFFIHPFQMSKLSNKEVSHFQCFTVWKKFGILFLPRHSQGMNEGETEI